MQYFANMHTIKTKRKLTDSYSTLLLELYIVCAVY